ncbi:hypothetical protein FALBO_11587 [Fusarium albosuccineum]|uniref:Uncharacterized protein n=1 Tax=Fusarium albosuccineum TaxID=1237068 RepID=A0A8H4P9Y5_9HYPO|nr:hypothetical protein FALBO_11587 [Fusarium albosuccineum]
MPSLATYAVLASATLAAAAIHPRFEFPDTVPALEKRQEPGTPRYQCHEDCGLLITLGREEGYCDNDEWNERYGRCMECANTFEIWQYYRNGVTSAAEECGLSPTPLPSGSSSTPSTTAAEEEPASTAEEEEQTTAAPEEPATTAAKEEAGTTAEEAESTAPADDDSTAPAEQTSTAAGAEETEAGEEKTTDATTGAAKPTTLATSAATDEAEAPSATETDSSGTKPTTGGSIGTIGSTPISTPTGVVVNGAAKNVGFSAAVGVAALAMLAAY